jgi:hypothetical protein
MSKRFAELHAEHLVDCAQANPSARRFPQTNKIALFLSMESLARVAFDCAALVAFPRQLL